MLQHVASQAVEWKAPDGEKNIANMAAVCEAVAACKRKGRAACLYGTAVRPVFI